MAAAFTFDPCAAGLSGAPAILAARGDWSFYLAATDASGAYQVAACGGPFGEPVTQFNEVDADQGAAILRDLFGLGEVPAGMLDQLKAAAVEMWDAMPTPWKT